jgi:hypothetical protein
VELGRGPEADDANARALAATRRTWFRLEAISVGDVALHGEPLPADFRRGIVDELGRFSGTVDIAYTSALTAARH